MGKNNMGEKEICPFRDCSRMGLQLFPQFLVEMVMVDENIPEKALHGLPVFGNNLPNFLFFIPDKNCFC